MESPNEDGITISERALRWFIIISHYHRLSEDIKKYRRYMKKVSILVRRHQKHYRMDRNVVFELQDGLMERAIHGQVDYDQLRPTIRRINEICLNQSLKNHHFMSQFKLIEAYAIEDFAEWGGKDPKIRFPDLYNVAEENLQNTVREWEDAHERVIEKREENGEGCSKMLVEDATLHCCIGIIR